MNLVDDEHFVFSYLRRNLHLLNQITNILDRIVGGCVQFMDVVRPVFIEGDTTFTRIASIPIGSGTKTIYSFRKDAGAGGLSYTTWATEKISMGQLTLCYGIFQRHSKSLLTNYHVKTGRTILPR